LAVLSGSKNECLDSIYYYQRRQVLLIAHFMDCNYEKYIYFGFMFTEVCNKIVVRKCYIYAQLVVIFLSIVLYRVKDICITGV